jgi:pimeloyl-ACP methyl ester carboxylesterase
MAERALTRVRSRDGTEIAYWTSGEGPPLLLIHGTAGIHERFDPLLPYLEPHASVHVMDRRGRGGSDDAPDYDLAREFEDVAAVVDSIAQSYGSRVAVYGHSFGGNCAVGAVALTTNISALALYEGWPPVRPELLDFPPEVEQRLDVLVSAGERDAALEFFMREVVRVPKEDIAAIRAQPTWAARVTAVHTITREIHAFFDNPFDPAQLAEISIPVLVLTGADSPAEIKDDPEAVTAALPDARLVVIEDQEHLADVLVPEVFAPNLLGILEHRAEAELSLRKGGR